MKSKGLESVNPKDFMFPGADFFKKPKGEKPKKRMLTRKHAAAYSAFVKWSATPKAIRDPKSQADFEKRWSLPVNYTSTFFKKREGYYDEQMKHFWTWMFDKFPDVVYAVYRRAVRNSTADAKIFTELIGKKIEESAPKRKIQPFMMIGIPQEKIDAMFVPESYEDAQVVEEEGESDVKKT